MEEKMVILLIIYWGVGYWAVGRTIYANKIVFGAWNEIFIQKMILALILGWLLIPLALIKSIFKR